jgi:hypothetical protein
MSKQIASSLTDFALDALLMQAIKAEGLNDSEGAEGDPPEGTGFEPVQDVDPSKRPATLPLTLHPLTAQRTTSRISTARSSVDPDAASSEPGSESDTAAPPTLRWRCKSRAAAAYKKLAFKRHRDALRQLAKESPGVDVQPSIRRHHAASAIPIGVPSFRMDMRILARTGYVGIRASKASRRTYHLSEMVGEGSGFNFNLVEWDGK